MCAATGLPYERLLSMSWEEVSLAAEAKKWREYAEWVRIRWLGAVVATMHTGKSVEPSKLLPLEFDGIGVRESTFEPSQERIDKVIKAWGLDKKMKGNGKR